jgi:hypothetical protein
MQDPTLHSLQTTKVPSSMAKVSPWQVNALYCLINLWFLATIRTWVVLLKRKNIKYTRFFGAGEIFYVACVVYYRNELALMFTFGTSFPIKKLLLQ